jgi:hypothetical protein
VSGTTSRKIQEGAANIAKAMNASNISEGLRKISDERQLDFCGARKEAQWSFKVAIDISMQKLGIEIL